jgi:Secretion system C-terminal sorting domain
VDVNIPNLKIGICSYERVTVNIGGAFASNVVAVRYAGYNGSSNCNCYYPSTPAGCAVTSTITGVASSIVTYVVLPPATFTASLGNNSIICAYQCPSTSSGGCNTPQQVVSYFLSAFGVGSSFRSHEAQYNCWAGATKNLSAGGNCCLTVLPIELLNFKSTCLNEKQRILNWSTASETNNDFFEIEKSDNGLTWKTIKTINGAGNSSELLHYSYQDTSYNTDNVYYRLKQTDFDSQYKYSSIISNECNLSKNQIITLYPNPANNQLYIDATIFGDIEIEIYNCLGQVVTHKNYVRASDNYDSYLIDVAGLTKGSYYAKISNSKQTFVGKFIK